MTETPMPPAEPREPISDELWERLEPHIPPCLQRHPKYSNREMLAGILFVLKNKVPWRGGGSLSALEERYRYWRGTGVWENIKPLLMAHYGDAIDLNRMRRPVSPQIIKKPKPPKEPKPKSPKPAKEPKPPKEPKPDKPLPKPDPKTVFTMLREFFQNDARAIEFMRAHAATTFRIPELPDIERFVVSQTVAKSILADPSKENSRRLRNMYDLAGHNVTNILKRETGKGIERLRDELQQSQASESSNRTCS